MCYIVKTRSSFKTTANCMIYYSKCKNIVIILQVTYCILWFTFVMHVPTVIFNTNHEKNCLKLWMKCDISENKMMYYHKSMFSLDLSNKYNYGFRPWDKTNTLRILNFVSQIKKLTWYKLKILCCLKLLTVIKRRIKHIKILKVTIFYHSGYKFKSFDVLNMC